jgi:hypothetical protein
MGNALEVDALGVAALAVGCPPRCRPRWGWRWRAGPEVGGESTPAYVTARGGAATWESDCRRAWGAATVQGEKE